MKLHEHDCVLAVEKYEAAGVDQMLLLVQAGRIPHEVTMETIRLFGEYVIPEFRRRGVRAHRAATA